MSEQKMEISKLLDSLRDKANVDLAETRTLHDGTTVYLLVGTLPAFPHGEKPTWYPLVACKGQQEIDAREVGAILRHFWHGELDFFGPPDMVKHSKSVLRRK